MVSLHECLSSFFVQALIPSRREVIRPAAKWSGASHNIQVVGHSSATSGVLTGDPGSAPSTSRDAKTNSSSTERLAICTPAHSSASGHAQPQAGASSHILSQPKLRTNPQQQDSAAVELHTFSPNQTPSTSTTVNVSATTSRAPLQELAQPQPSTSGLTQPQAGPSAHVTAEPLWRTSNSATHYSCAVASSTTKTQERGSTGTSSRDNPQASTSAAQSHAQVEAGGSVPNPVPQAGTSGTVPPTHGLNVRLPNVNSNPHTPAVPTASAPSSRGEARLVLAPAPNPERVNPAPGLVAVPPVPEDIPRIEDARPGPSAPRETEEQSSLLRTLISGVVSVTSEQTCAKLINCLI